MVTKEEIFKKKKKEIIGVLNLALIMINGDMSIEALRNRVAKTITLLENDLDVLDSTDEFLELQKKIFGDEGG